MNLQFKIEHQKDFDSYQIVIFDSDLIASNETILHAKAVIFEIAKETPLYAIALIQKLASLQDLDALFLQCVYQSYKKFLVDNCFEHFESICQNVLRRTQNKDSIRFQIAHYIQNLIEGEETENPSFKQAKDWIETLIPGFVHSLLHDSFKIHKELAVQYEGMNLSHHAFPDIVAYQNKTYIAFREGKSHGGHGDLGKIVILEAIYNSLQKNWDFKEIIKLESPSYDLRDPHFFITPSQTLKLIIGGLKVNKKGAATEFKTHVASLDNNSWKIEEAVLDESLKQKRGQWIWRVTLNPKNNRLYGFSYGIKSPLHLVESEDGIRYKKVMTLKVPDFKESLNEATLRFDENGKAFALIRTEKNGLLLTSDFSSDYLKWQYQSLNVRLGGPNFLLDKNKRVIAGSRFFFLNPDNTLDFGTVIGFIDHQRFIPLIRFESDQDTSYPGMLLENDDEITFLYYSGKCQSLSSLYITKIKN